MSTKLELLIELDSKGAVQGVKALNTEVDKLGKTSQTTDKDAGSLFKTIIGSTAVIWATSKAVGALTAFVSDSTDEFLKGEKAQREFEFSLRQVGLAGEVNVKTFGEFADSLSDITTVSETDIKQIMSLGLRMGLASDQIQDATKNAIGLSKAFGIDLNSAMMVVVQATEGNFRGMQRFLPEMKNAVTISDKFTIAQKAMADGLVMATEEINSLGGQMAQAENRIKETQEKIGRLGAEFKNLTYMILEPCTDVLLVFIETLRRVDEYQIKDTTAKQFNENKLAFEAAAEAAGVLEQEQRKLFEEFGKISTGQTGMEIYGNALDDLIAKYPAAAKGFNEYYNAQKPVEVEQKKLTLSTVVLTENTGKLVEAEKTLIETMNERWAAFNKNLTQDEAYADFVAAKLGPAIDSASDAWAENFDITNMINESQKQFDATLGEIIPTIKKASDQTKQWTIDWQDANSVLEASAQLMDVVKQGLSDLGVELGPQAEAFMGAAEGAQIFVDGLIKGNPLTMIAGAVKFLGGVVKAFAGDGIGEAIKRENEWMNLNEALEKQLRDLAETMGDTHKATSIMLDDIIDQADVTVANFATYVYRVNEILSDYDRNTLSLSQTQTEIGDSFTSLITKAKALGTEGSASILKLIDDLNSRGIRVKEIQDYINANWKAGLEGYKKYLEGDFSKATIGVFEYLLAYEKKVGANQALVDGIAGITQALIGMSNVIKLTEEEFDKFEMAGRDAYNKLIAQGFTSRESLMQLQPMLSRMIWLQKEYGLTIDAATQALIDKAKADGVDLSLVKSQDELFGDMADSLAELVDIFRNVFPKAVDESTEALERFNRTYRNPEIPGAPGPPGPPGGRDEPAALGWQGWVAGGSNKRFLTGETEPEYVSITPMSKMRGRDAPPGGGAKTVSINITLAGTITPENAADAITTAYRNNTRGLKSLLEN